MKSITLTITLICLMLNLSAQEYFVSVQKKPFQSIANFTLGGQFLSAANNPQPTFVGLYPQIEQKVEIDLPFDFAAGTRTYNYLNLYTNSGYIEFNYGDTTYFAAINNGILNNDEVIIMQEEVFTLEQNNQFIIEFHHQLVWNNDDIYMLSQIVFDKNGSFVFHYKMLSEADVVKLDDKFTNIAIAEGIVTHTDSAIYENTVLFKNLVGNYLNYTVMNEHDFDTLPDDYNEHDAMFQMDLDEVQISFNPSVSYGLNNVANQTSGCQAEIGMINGGQYAIYPLEVFSTVNTSNTDKKMDFTTYKDTYSKLPKGMYVVQYELPNGQMCRKKVLK